MGMLSLSNELPCNLTMLETMTRAGRGLNGLSNPNTKQKDTKTMTDKNKQTQGKKGALGTWTGTGFIPKPTPKPKKSISLLDIILGRK